MSREKLEQAKRKWEEKLAHYEYELSITAGAPQKFELRERIQECQEEIKRIKTSLKSLGKDGESLVKVLVTAHRNRTVLLRMG